MTDHPEIPDAASFAREPLRVTLLNKVHFLIRELKDRARPMPSVRQILSAADLQLMTDEEVFILLDRQVLGNQLQHQKFKEFENPAIRALLIDGARRLGLKPILAAPKSIASFRDHLLENNQSDLDMHALIDAFDQGLALYCLSSELPLSAILGDPATASGLFLRPSGDAPCLTGVQFETLMANANAFLASVANPADLATALQAALDHNGLSARSLGMSAGVEDSFVRSLLAGKKPRPFQVEKVRRLEAALELPPGSLTDRVEPIGNAMKTDDVLTVDVRKKYADANIKLTVLGHDWSSLSDKQKRDRLRYHDEIGFIDSSYRAFMRAKNELEISHKGLPPLMQNEFEALRKFKMGETQDFSFRRRFANGTARRGITNGGIWKRKTAELVRTGMARCITALKELIGDDAPRLEQLAQIGIAVFFDADVMAQLTFWIAERRFQTMTLAGNFDFAECDSLNSKQFFTAADASRVITLAGLLNEETGYFFHYMPTLKPLDGYISTGWITDAKADWQKHAQAQRKKLMNLARFIEEQVRNQKLLVRDPWRNIEPILDLKRPLEPLYQALDRLGFDRPAFEGAPLATALHDRDYLMLSLWLHTRLRRDQIRKITYRADNWGQLRRSTDGLFKLVLPRSDFKNANSKALKGKGPNVEIDLPGKDARLHQAIERWLIGDGASRTLLYGESAGDWLFPGIQGKRLGDGMVYNIVVNFTAHYLVWTPWQPDGIKGVLPFGPHAVRDITVTHFLICFDGDVHKAAATVFDTPETIQKHYGRWTTLAKSQSSNEAIAASVQRL